VEFKLAKVLQLFDTIKRTIFRKVRTKTILKIHNILVLPTFLYGSENWTLTVSQRRKIEAAELKLYIKQDICQLGIQNWLACVQDRGKWKEAIEKARTFN
jgi:hypothetical protein